MSQTTTPAALPNLTPEQELLVLCCSRDTPERRERLARRLAGALDWEEVLRLAVLHHAAGWLCPALEGLPAPPEALARLTVVWLENTDVSLCLCAELPPLLSRFQSAGIEVLVFKGPALAAQFYGDLAKRSFDDLDLLVREEDLGKAQQVLIELGYAPAFELRGAAEESWRRTSNERPYFRREENLAVDLHWGLTAPRLRCVPATEDLFRRAETVSLDAVEMRTLALPDHLLAVFLHAAKHGWQRLAWVCDVARVAEARADQPDDPVWKIHLRPGAGRPARWGWALANELLDAPLPAEVAEAIAHDPSLPGLLRGARRMMFDPYRPEELWAPRSLYARSMDDRGDWFRVWRYFVLTPSSEDWRVVSLPSGWSGAYLLIRPFRAAWKHGRRVLGFLNTEAQRTQRKDTS